ncbi:MAG: NapC/NirT family cytochrome c [bacterium]|nr:NapC/NirT family cytochrome c [bacterium]
MKFLTRIFTVMRRLRFYEILLLAFVAVVLGALSVMEITNSAIFCGNTCHIMRPYYEDWKSSAHVNVPCVDCHLEPTDEQQFVPEFRALGQVASYLTRAYGEHSRAEVSDANCLTEECHSRRLLDGRVTFADNITFDHTPHLQRLRRGKILRCTTCHSRVAMGEHVTVVEDACFICHFKANGQEPATAKCTICHDPAGLDFSAGIREEPFEHGTYVDRGVPCRSCHQGVVGGDGRIRTCSCVECHGQSMEAALSEPVELLHRMHVTDHKVKCGTCHEPIRHTSHGDSSSAALGCSSCHESRHSGIWSMYSGTGATGVSPLPSPMHEARVGCNGCHTVPTPVDGNEREFSGTTMIAVEAACKGCHIPGYEKMIGTWKKEIETALTRDQDLLDRIRADLGKDRSPGDRRIIELADRNIRFVRFGVPVHNRDYALSILEKTIGDLERISDNSKKR